MCGIVGMINRRFSSGFYNKDLVIFNELLYADVLRGDDSTGVFGVRESGNVDVLKSADVAGVFMNDGDWYDDFQRQSLKNHKFVVGHNRKATKGKITDLSAHPFYEGDVVLVHNGTLWDHKKLADTEVDSHAICHAINELGHKEALDRINGAYALAWYDNRDKTFRLARNKERPLGILKNDTHYFFASEPNLLYWILSRNDVDIQREKLEAIFVEPGKIYEFPLKTKFNDDDLNIVSLEALEVASSEVKKSPGYSTTEKQENGKKKEKIISLPDLTDRKSTSQKESVRSSATSYLAPVHDAIISFTMNGWAKRDEVKDWPSVYAQDCDVMITGTNPKWPDAIIRAYTTEDRMETYLKLVSNDLFSGKVIGHSYKEGKCVMISLVDVSAEVSFTSKNKIKVTSEIWNGVSHTCDICHTLVGLQDIPDCYFSYTKTKEGYYRKHKLQCKKCAKVTPIYYGDYCGED